MALAFHQKVGMVALSLAAPQRLARILLKPYPQPMKDELQLPPTAERVEFPTAGGLKCRGWWVPREAGEGPHRCVVLAHGWTSHALRMALFVRPLVADGFDVLLYSARSHGDSDYYPFCSLAQFTEDLRAAVDFAHARVSEVAVLGHSLGGAAAIVAAAEGAQVGAVVALAAPSHPEQASLDILEAEGVPAELILRRIRPHVEGYIGRRFEEIAPERLIGRVACPVLLVHGTEDEVIPVSHYHRTMRGAGANVEGLLVEGANHDSVKEEPRMLARVRQFLGRWAGAGVGQGGLPGEAR